MVDRIGRTIVLYEKLTADNLVERMDTLQFGAVLQTIETKVLQTQSRITHGFMVLKMLLNSRTHLALSKVTKRTYLSSISQNVPRGKLIRSLWYSIEWRLYKRNNLQRICGNDFQDMYNAMELAKNDLQHGVISTAIASAIHAGTKELNPIPTMARNLYMSIILSQARV